MRFFCALLLPASTFVSACSGGKDSGGGKASVTVEVIDGDGAAASGVTVVFHDEDGEVVSVAESDAEGLVDASVPDGGMVTVAFDYGGFHALETIVGVEDDDHLYFQRNEGPVGMTLQVTFPGTFPGATGYGVNAGCELATTTSTAGTLDVDVPVECITSAIGAFAYGTAGTTQPLAFAIANPVGTGTVPVNIAAWRTDWEDIPVTVSGLPIDDDDFLFASAYVGTYVDRRFLALPVWRRSIAASTAEQVFDLKRVPSIGIAQHAGMTVYFEEGSFAIFGRDESLPASVSFDVADALPRVRNVLVSFDDPARPTVSWTTDAAIEADVLEIVGNWDDGYWWMRMPPGFASPLRAPELPAELSAWLPPTDATARVEYEEMDYRDGYDAERNANWIEELLPESWQFRRSSGDSS